MEREIKTLHDLILALEETINIPENHHIIAVFQDDEHDEIEGWIVAENNVEGDYPIYSSEELLEIYGIK